MSFDRSQPPARRAPVESTFPAFERHRLENGLTLWSCRRDHAPLVTLQIVFEAGGHANPESQPGLAGFTADLLEEGTSTRSSEEIAQHIESLGGRLASGAGWNTASASFSLLSSYLADGLDLLSDSVIRPAFADDEIERLRRERLAEILRMRSQAGALASTTISSELYRGTVYGVPLVGGEAAVASIQRDDLVAFHETRYRSGSAHVIAVGDFESHELASQVVESFGTLTAGETPPYPPVAPPAAQRRVVIVDRPNAAQTEIRVGQVGQPRDHPDRSALTFLNSLLGGKFTSRLNLNLRERHGYTYGARTAFAHRIGPGPFVASAAVGTDVTGAALRETLGELTRIQTEPPTTEEIEDTRSYLLGVFPYGLQTNGGILQHLRTLAIFGLEEDYWQTWQNDIATIDAPTLARVAKDHLHPETMTLVAVGPASELQPQLEEFGPTEVVQPDTRFR